MKNINPDQVQNQNQNQNQKPAQPVQNFNMKKNQNQYDGFKPQITNWSVNQNLNQEEIETKLKPSNFLRFFELSRSMVLIIMLLYIVYLFLFTFFIVSGPSMEPNYQDKEILLVNKASYWFSEPKRGDVVIFYFPGQKKIKYIKRIIALPGERLELKNNAYYLNGNLLEEKYIPKETITSETIFGKNRWVVPENQYFISGDNRPNSNDSRVFAPISKSEILGKVEFRLFPFNSLGIPK